MSYFSPPHEVAELTHRSEGLPDASAPRPRGTEWVRLLAMGFVRDAHFYRRVPTDVSEATKSGGLVSIFAFVTIVWLVLAQFNESYSTKRTTQLKLDRNSNGGEIRINFNLTMHHLPCQYASLHLADHVGSHKMGGARNVHKVRLSRSGAALGMFEPHKYNQADDKASGMAGHVFPWHKKEHTQVRRCAALPVALAPPI